MQSLNQVLKQTTSLSPQQIQFIKLLQIPTAELDARIQEELEVNPALDEGRGEDKDIKDKNEDDSAEDKDDEFEELEEISIDDYLNNDDAGYKMYGDGNTPEEDRDIPMPTTSTLIDSLLSQLGFLGLPEKEEIIGKQIIGTLDNDGYLRRPIEAVVNDLAFTQDVDTDEESVLIILKKIQQFDPPGIAARNLEECLLLQLYRKHPKERLEDIKINQHQIKKKADYNPYNEFAIKILENSFEEFTKKHYDKIKKKLLSASDSITKLYRDNKGVTRLVEKTEDILYQKLESTNSETDKKQILEDLANVQNYFFEYIGEQVIDYTNEKSKYFNPPADKLKDNFTQKEKKKRAYQKGFCKQKATELKQIFKLDWEHELLKIFNGIKSTYDFTRISLEDFKKPLPTTDDKKVNTKEKEAHKAKRKALSILQKGKNQNPYNELVSKVINNQIGLSTFFDNDFDKLKELFLNDFDGIRRFYKANRVQTSLYTKTQRLIEDKIAQEKNKLVKKQLLSDLDNAHDYFFEYVGVTVIDYTNEKSRYFNSPKEKEKDNLLPKEKKRREALKQLCKEKKEELEQIFIDDLSTIIDIIVKLNPKPGSTGASFVKNQYIIPDFILTNNNGKLDLNLNAKNAPELRVNHSYAEMLESYSKSDKKNKVVKETVSFVKQKLDAAKWFIDAIKQRQQTLLRTMDAIITYQEDFFLEGDESKLKPMILKDIADKIGMDISTISRVANSKSIQTNFGIYPLKYFFSEGISTQSGEDVSSREVKHVLKQLVDGEDKRKPLSDDKLEKLLKDNGYKIARRTVAKYREQLNIPVARLRKRL